MNDEYRRKIQSALRETTEAFDRTGDATQASWEAFRVAADKLTALLLR